MGKIKSDFNIERVAAAVSIGVVIFSVGIWVGHQTQTSRYDRQIARLELALEARNQEIQQLRNKVNTHADLQTPVNWAGVWETDTATQENLRVTFSQSGNRVIGTYETLSKNGEPVQGRIEGEARDNILVGRWERLGTTLDGNVLFVLFDTGKSFLGSYTRAWENHRETYVWSGKKIE